MEKIRFAGIEYSIDVNDDIADNNGIVVKDKHLIFMVRAVQYVSKQSPETIKRRTIYTEEEQEDGSIKQVPWFILLDKEGNFKYGFNSEEGINNGLFGPLRELWAKRLEEGEEIVGFVAYDEDDEQILSNKDNNAEEPKGLLPEENEHIKRSRKSPFRTKEEEMKALEGASFDGCTLDDDNFMIEIGRSLFGDDDSYTIWGAKIKSGKGYLDKDNSKERWKTNYKHNGHERDEFILKINPENEWLSDIINQLPHGLINKQVTGIGATYLELYSKRHSIIVTPTRALALNKMENNFLYVGSIVKRTVTTKGEIIAYLNDENIEYKKILVVADSIDKVIDAIKENEEDVYKDYFLLIDEIDTLQSDNHYRPVLSRVIDHYFKFKKWKRALLSATVKDFTHPDLKEEPMVSIISMTKLKRNINAYYTGNINSLLSEKIIEITEKHPKDKILIAYNSVLNILQTIKSLPEDLLSNFSCGILCSEASKEEAGVYYKTLDKENNLFSCRINFMTCSYFAGIDIKDKYHLITVCDSRKVYSALPLNKIMQIYGRCRIPNGILSDTIIYNNKKMPLKNLETYREHLSNKAKKVIDLLDKADELKKGDADLTDLFSRIHKVIIERATEYLFNQQSFELTRETIDKKLEISYFNIDALYEKMEAYSKYYSHKEGLYNHLKKIYPTTKFYDNSDNENDINDTEIIDSIKEESNLKLQNNILRIKDELISMNNENSLTEDYLVKKINSTKRGVMDYYKRIKDHYKYYDIKFLAGIFSDIALKNKKAYRNLNNLLSFIALDNRHPFKTQVYQSFKIGKKYSSEEIADILSTIIKDQNFKTIYSHQRSLINHFKSFVDYTYTGGVYLIKGYKPKYNNVEIPEPIKRIPKEQYAIDYLDL